MRKKGREWYKIERGIDLAIFKRKRNFINDIRFYIRMSKIAKKWKTPAITLRKNARRRFLELKGYTQDEILISGMYKGN